MYSKHVLMEIIFLKEPIKKKWDADLCDNIGETVTHNLDSERKNTVWSHLLCERGKEVEHI